MITGEVKNKVDAIWDTIWTGGITSPITVLEQITYLIFMKLLDDNQLKAEANANILGVPLKNKVFKDGICVISEEPRIETDYQNLRWHVFHNFEPKEMLDTVQTYVFPFIKNIGEGKDTAFSRYMKDTVFLIPTAKVLAKVVDGIDDLDMDNKDIMGDVYEYLLGKIAAAGENGQFRTPRHIINMMVQLMQPTLKDKILDPAMGSAGFLLESAKYISEQQKNDLVKVDNLKYFKSGLFSGFDTDQSMLRIGAMNMILHGVEAPNIRYQDSLSAENTERDDYTLIMANPPFKGSVFQEEISKDLLALTKTKKTELLFLSLFLKMLKVGGRCACIVPDGVLFGSSAAHKAIRKELVENQHLQAVISMPSGVFKPYAGVSTGILIFTKTDSGGTDNVWFYDMKADGFSLDDKRTAISDNDIPDIIARYHSFQQKARPDNFMMVAEPEKDYAVSGQPVYNEKERKRTEQSFFVPKQEIVDNGYDLSINKYKEVEYVAVEYPPSNEILAELKDLQKQIDDGLAELEAML
ncbi:MAG: SAM-dependent DNA methyltransferase [Peptococcaceae bacterium]|nr:SAM-dependent DNA methyltransferase [Peptococcaceae bacterium]